MDQFFYEFNKLSFENLNRQIRLADNKAKFLLSLDLAVISGLSAFALKFFPEIKDQANFELIVTLFCIAITFLIASLFFTIYIITPKANPDNNPSKLLYWGQISQQDIQHIQDKYWNTTSQEKMEELINQIYFYSHTATAKYRRVRFAVYTLFIALILIIATLIITITKLQA